MENILYLHNRVPSILVGVACGYFVTAELPRSGSMASTTLRNMCGIDILATYADATHSINIQVKTYHGYKTRSLYH